MHTPHIKQQAFGHSINFQTRKTKAALPDDRDLVIPVSEWESGPKQQRHARSRQQADATSDGPFSATLPTPPGGATAGKDLHDSNQNGLERDETLQGLLDAVSPESGSGSLCPTAKNPLHAEPSLEDLLNAACGRGLTSSAK